MVIGVISDTHGNRKLMHEAADRIQNEFHAEVVLHAGDDYPDAQELGHAGHPVRMVPGLWCAEYHNHRIPNQLVDTIGGISLAMVHADKDLTVQPGDVALVITGHTHVAEIREVNGTVYLNPGHLKALSDRGQKPSFAIVGTDAEELRITIYELRGGRRLVRTYDRSALAQE